jgi:hypothetical protein
MLTNGAGLGVLAIKGQPVNTPNLRAELLIIVCANNSDKTYSLAIPQEMNIVTPTLMNSLYSEHLH